MADRHADSSSKAKRYKGSFVVLVAVCVGIVSFVAGTRGEQLFSVISPYTGIKINTDSLDLKSLQDTYRVLEDNYVDKLDKQKLIDYANKGLAEATGDKYTKYFTADEAAKYADELSGDIGGGIGAKMGKRHDRITVLKPLKNSPAKKAGLKSGDIVVEVNDKKIDNMSLSDVVDMIRGEVDTTVKIKVLRGKHEKQFSIKREEITAPDVETKVKNNIGIMTVSRFDKKTGLHIRSAAEDFKKRDVDGVVLDLRGNGGGYLQAAVDTASVWLKDKTVVTERRSGKIEKTLKSDSDPVFKDMPTVVLIDGGTASASEIVSGALHDYGKAKLIGQQSFGKGSVQSLIDLPNGAELKVTIARWYTPNGKNITKKGITPDDKISISSDDINNGKDPQLKYALGWFNNK